MTILDRLPDIFPKGEIRVEGEKYLYKVSVLQDGSKVPQKQVFTLDKAPVERVESVIATVDERERKLEAGVDYEIVDSEQIDFSIGGDSPDLGTNFEVTYVAESIISRYIGVHDSVLQETEQDIESTIDSNHIDNAEGDELDAIGSLFGPFGERAGRDDINYRTYLKSIVRSFSGRGTLDGVKFAVSSGLGDAVPEEEITIVEDFEENEYTIEIRNFGDLGDINLATVNNLAELADPSGVRLKLINFGFDPIPSTMAGTESVEELTFEEVQVAHADTVLDWTTTVSSVNNGNEVVLDTSYFHPEQEMYPADEGTINDIEVTNVIKSGSEIVHILEQEPSFVEGASVDAVITDTFWQDRGSIDVNSLRSGDEVAFTEDELERVDDFNRLRTDEIQVSAYNTGAKNNIDLYRDPFTGVTEGQKIEVASDSKFGQTEDTFQETSEVQVASVDYGRDQIDVSHDPNTPTIGPDPEAFEDTDIPKFTDTQSQRTDKIAVAYAQNGFHKIDVCNVLNPDPTFKQSSDSSSIDFRVQHVEPVNVATAEHGRGDIDVSFDPDTDVIGDDPDSFEDDDTVEFTETQAHRTDELSVAQYHHGIHQIDVYNLLERELNTFNKDSVISEDTFNETVEEVQVASADYGRDQIDITADGITPVIGDNPELYQETDTQSAGDEKQTTIAELLITSYNYGQTNIDLYDDGNTDISGPSTHSTFTHTDSSGLVNTIEQTVQEVSVALAQEAQSNISANTLSNPKTFDKKDPSEMTESTSQTTEEITRAYANEGRTHIDTADV